MENEIEKYSGNEQNKALSELISYADDTFGNEHMIAALPYLFACMRPSEVATALTDAMNSAISQATVKKWLANDDYRRVVSAGRRLMVEWNLTKLQQLSVMSMNFLANELAEPALTMAERRHKAGIARFVIQQQSKTSKKDKEADIDLPSMLVGAQSVALVAQQIALAIDGKSRMEDRDTIIVEGMTVEKDTIDSVNVYDGPVPMHGVVNIDFDEGSVQCHICSTFVTSIYQHLEAHGVSIDEYRSVYGIPESTPLSFDRIINDHPDGIDRSGWRGSKIVVLDEEKGLIPYDESENDAADSKGGEELADGVGNKLSETT